MHILTAAHCFVISDTKEETINLGDKVITAFQPYNHRLASIDDYKFILNERGLKGIRLIIHPEYFFDSITNTNFDLAVIELDEPIDKHVKIPKYMINLMRKEWSPLLLGMVLLELEII